MPERGYGVRQYWQDSTLSSIHRWFGSQQVLSPGRSGEIDLVDFVQDRSRSDEGEVIIDPFPVIERAVITSRAETLTLPEDFAAYSATAPLAPDETLSTMEEMESNYIRRVLERTRGRISGEASAAQILGMHPNTLRSRMSKLGVARATTHS